jgi:hypothetical protein
LHVLIAVFISGFTSSQLHISFFSSQNDKARFVNGQFGFPALHAHGCLADSGVYYTPSTFSKAAATPGYGYTSEADHVPMPMSRDSWNSFPHYPLPSDFQPNQRVVHTQVCKQIDVGTGSNNSGSLKLTQKELKGFVHRNFSSMELWLM